MKQNNNTPETVAEYRNKSCHYAVHVVQHDDAWYCGVDADLPTEGMGWPCAVNGRQYATRQEALNAGLGMVQRWLQGRIAAIRQYGIPIGQTACKSDGASVIAAIKRAIDNIDNNGQRHQQMNLFD